jgi:dolichol-phosphate mannosyltransferase
VYCESENLPVLRRELGATLETLAARGYDWEIVFVDDASTDATPDVLRAMAADDPRIKVIRLVRNFGSQAAIMAGLRAAGGDCAVLISADLQEPPATIVRLVEGWEEGYRLVVAARENVPHGFLDRVLSRLFYATMNRIGSVRFPEKGADTLLLDHRVLRDLLALEERNLSVFGLILWLGYPTKVIPYHRDQRLHGTSGWTFLKRVKIFVDAVIAFSYLPFRVFSLAGLAVLAGSFGYLAFLVVNRIFFWDGTVILGWTSLMVVMLLLNGFLILGLGILGEYVWRILDEVRRRPLYLVDHTINLGGRPEPSGPASVRGAPS